MSEALDEVMAVAAAMTNDAGPQEQPSAADTDGRQEQSQAEGLSGQPPTAQRAEDRQVSSKKGFHGRPIPAEKKPKPVERTRGPSRLARGSRPEDAAATLGPIPGPSNAAAKPKASASTATAKQPEVATPQAGLRTPVLLRNAYSAGLARVFATKALSNPAPAATVMEAQESGEQRQIQDSMLYALDGLHAGASLATQRESAAALLDICSTRRGRLALMADGLFEDAMAGGLALLQRAWDGEMGVAFAAILLAFSKDASTQAVLARREGVLLLTHLLAQGAEKVPLGAQSGAPELSASGAKVAKLIRDGAISRGVTAEAAASTPTALAVLAVIGMTDPQSATPASDDLKTALRKHGAVAELIGHISSSKHVEQDTGSWKLLHLFLMALENCSFACADNEAYVVGLPVRQAGRECTVGACLVALVDRLDDEQGRAEDPQAASQMRECLHTALSVVMNMSHHNDAGCRQVVEAGILPTATRLLASHRQACGGGRGALLDAVDAVSMAMGVLINVVEGYPQAAEQIVRTPLPDGSRLLPLLCYYMQEFSLSPGEGTAGDVQGEEVTAEELLLHEEEGRAAIVQVYAALLVGFLVAPSPELRAEVAAVLPCGSIAPVVEGVQKCLEFYLSTGSITQETERSLRGLLVSLEAP